MKTRIFPGWLFGMLLAAAAAASGFAQNGLNTPPKTSSSDPAATPAPNISAAPQSSPASSVVPGKQSAQPVPSPTSLSPWSHEIEKLVQAGVDERVITTFITNSAGIFNLSPDDIVCLKNLGVSSSVLNVMLQHDQRFISSAGPMTAATAPPATPIAIATVPGESQIVGSDDSWAQEPVVAEDDYYAPEQPEGIGPVRAPYAVKLNDPIIMLRVPTLTVPCW